MRRLSTSDCVDSISLQTGRDEQDGYDRAGEVKSLWPVGVVQISCGDNHSLVLSASGAVFAWGRGKYGQLGLGSFDNSSLPVQVQLPGQAAQVRQSMSKWESPSDDHMIGGKI